MARKPVPVFKRPMSGRGFRYYVQFWDPATGAYGAHRSADSLAKELALYPASFPSTSRTGALLIGQEYLARRGRATRTEDPLFVDYCEAFWDWDGSSYVRSKLERGQRIGREYVLHNAAYVRNHLRPAFPRLKLSEVKPYVLEEFTLALKNGKGLGASSVNGILNAAAIPLGEAARLGLIPSNPAAKIRKIANACAEKGIPSEDEVRRLLILEGLDPRIRCAILVGAACALRLGEIQALRLKDLGENTITVSGSWGKFEGLKETKTGRIRIVPVPAPVRRELVALAETGPHGHEGFLMFGLSPDAPLDARAIERGFYKALALIGMDEAERKRRRISFHSLRHWSNAMLRGAVPDAKLRLLTGHATPSMTERYDHATEGDLAELRQAQERRILPVLR